MATFTWTNSNSGDWTDPANWDLGSVPGSGDEAVLPNAAGTAAVASGDSLTLDSLVSRGGTLALGDAAVLTVTAALTLGGVIQGGTLQTSGASTLFQGGTLSGVTYQGTLSLAGTGQSLFVENGLTLDGAAGVGTPGSIDLTEAVASGISILDSETLDNATLSFGGGDASLDTGVGPDAGQTLTLGGGFTVDVNAGDGALGFQNTVFSVDDIGDTLDNNGLISVANDSSLYVDYGAIVSVGTIQVDGSSALIANGQSGFLASFDNQGSIGVSDGAYFLVGATTTGNEGTITLTTGGVLEVANQLTNAGRVSVDHGPLLLDSGLINAVTGQITVTDAGGLYIDAGAVTNSGTIEADGSTFDDYGTQFDNQGSIAITTDSYTYLGATTTSNEGTITVTTGGQLDVASQLTNAGGVSVDNGRLFLDSGLTSAVTGQITVTDAGALYIDGGVFDNQGSIAIATDSNAFISANAASNEGTIAVATGSTVQVTSQLTNAGGVSVDAGQLYLDSGLTNAVTGQITVSDAGALYMDGWAIDNQGSIAIANDSNAFISANAVSNEGTIAITAGSTVQMASQLTNAGLISVDAGQLDLDDGFTDAGAGQISLTDGATLVVDGNVTAADFASITGGGGTVEINGTLEGVSVTAPGNAIFHVGDTGNEALIVANTAQTGSSGFTAAATGAFNGDLTGTSGSTGDIAPGGTDASSVNVTFSTAAAAGSEAGAAGVALNFDGSATPVIINVPVSVTVDNYATAAIQLLSGPGVLTQTGNIYTLDLGSVPAGGIENLDSLDLANLAPAGQPADWLTGNLDGSGDAAFANNGLGAFGTLNVGQVTPFSVDLSTANTGTFSETITLAGIDGNSSGFSLAQDATLVVTGTAAPVAVAQINTPTPIVLPDAHVATGGTPDDTVPLSVANAGTTAAPGLFAAVTTLTGGAYGSGRISDLGAGETDDSSIVVGVNNTSAGALSGDVTLAFGSGGTGVPGDDLVENGDFSNGLTGWTSGNAVDGAGSFGIPGFESNPDFLTFGAVGHDADTGQTLATVPGVEYQIQFWYYSSGGHPNDLNVWFGGTDVVSLTNPPNTGWTEYTADATATSASTVLTLAGRNDPTWDALDDISVSAVDGGSYPLPPQTFSVSGNVYRLAAPVVNGNIYVHPGDPGSTALTLTNQVPADGYSEGLDAAIVGPATGGLTGASGATGDIAAGGTDASSLVVDFSTGTVGVTTGTVPVALTSDGTDVDSLGLTSLGTVDVPVTVSVDNYATASIRQYAGNGALTQNGSVYALNLGTFGLGGGSYTYLDVANTASGPADWLTGSLSALGDPVFVNQNIGAVGTLDAGASDDFQVGMSILAFGTYTETITLTATDGNPSGFLEALPTETLVVTGTVVPQLESGYVFQNTGSTLYVGPGTSFETFTLQGGTIEGGTVVDTGSGMVFEGGALSGVTYDGTLDLTPAYASLDVINGLTATGEDGSGPGVINLGYDSSVTFEDNQTLDNATVTVGANYASMYQYTTYNYYFGNSNTTGTLTLGPNLTFDQLGAYGNLGSNGYGGGTIVNQGSFNADAGYGYYSINPTIFDNAGQITVDSGEALYIDPATFTNEADGTVAVESGATLYLGGNGGAWTNDGSIVIEAGGNLFLQGIVPTSKIGSIADDGGVIDINGTLNNAGATLDVGSGTALSQVVVSNGEILGGVIQDFGRGLRADGNYWNILNGVTYEGTLDLSAQSNSYLHLQNGTTLIGAAGSGPGTVLATGYYDHLIVDGTQTLDNATIDMGNAANGWWDYLESYDGAGPAVLTLGPNLLIQQTGYYAQIDSTNGAAGSQIVNLGTINTGVAGLGGTRFYVYGPLFDNQASISIANGVYFYDDSGVFSNEGSITIAGGSELEVQNPLANTGAIAVEQGELRLDAGFNDLGTISIAPSGTVLLPNGATVAEIEALEANNEGTIAINGPFDDTGQTLTITNGIVLFQNTITNNGTMVVNGATLLLDNGLNGAGEIDLSPSGILASGANLLQIDGANLGGTLAGTLANDGGSLALVSGFTIAAGITDTVTFEGAQFGWYSNGYATLSGPGTLASLGTVNVTDWGGGQAQLLLTGGITWENFGSVYDRDVVQFGTAAGDGGAIVNEAGALFDLADGDGSITNSGTGGYSFVNLGTLQKDNGGNSYVTVPVINSGLVTSTNGLLELRGGTLGGTIYSVTGAVGMVGTYTSSAGTTNTVTFGGSQADLGWFSDGYATFSGPGTLASSGQVNVSDWGGGQVQLQVAGGITWENNGSVYARDVVRFGAAAGDSATIVNEAGALFDLASGDGSITNNGTGGYNFFNLGTLQKDNGGNSYVTVPVINSGLITSTNGLLELRGGTLGGTIYSVTGAVGMVGIYTSAGGTTNTVAFGGGQADLGWFGDGFATFSGPGTLVSSGQVNVSDWGGGQVQLLLAAGITWENYGSVYARDVVQFGSAAGDSATLVNESGALFDLASGDARLTTDGAGDYNFVNDGTVLQNAGGNDYFETPLTNAGLVETTNGFLEIDNATLGGTFESNGGNLALVGVYAAASGVTDTVDFVGATLGWYGDGAANLTGAGTVVSTGDVFVQDWGGGNTQLIVGGGVTWNNAGTVYDYGLTVLTGGAVWDNTGTVYDRYRLRFGAANGDSATFINEAGALFDLNTGSSGSETPFSGTYVFINHGTLLQNGGGSDYFSANLNNTGLVETTNGFFEIDNATLGGTFEANGGNLVLVGTYTAAANTTNTVDFQSAVLGWYGDGIAVLAGPGTQASTGVVTVNDWGGNTQLELTGGIVWNNAGTVYERGKVVLGLTTGDSATIDNQAGGVIDLTSDDGQLLSNGSGTYDLTNAGLLEKTGGGGISHVQAVLDETSTGTISVTSGTIAFDAGGTVSGLVNGGGAIILDGASETVTATGNIDSTSLYVTAGTLVMQGGTIDASNLSFGAGVEVIGFGDISDLVNNGLIDASDGLLAVNGSVTGGGAFQIETGATLELGGVTAQNVTFNGTGATLTLDDPSGFTGRLLNLGVGDGLDLVNTVVTSAAIANGSVVAHLSTGGSLVFAAPTTNVGAELVYHSDGHGGTQLRIIPSNVTAQPEIVTSLGPNNSIALPDAHVVAGTPNDQVTLIIENTATAPADGLDAGIAVANGAAYGTGTITSLAAGGTNSSGIAIGLNNTSAGAKSGAVNLSFATDGSVSGIAGAIIPQGEFDEISIASVVNASFQNLINGGEFNSILGSTTGNQGTGIPFLVANTPNNYWSGAGGTSSITIPVGVNTSTVYTLADNINGATGNDEYSITFTPTSGSPITEQYVGGVNTKDYNGNSGTDGTATTPDASYWFIDGAGGQWLQTVAWRLPNGFGTLASVTVTQVNSPDGVIFAGLTVVQPGGTSFADAPINLSGNVYRYAAPSVTAPANGVLHVGDDGGTVTEALTVANTAPADGFSEGLDASATGAVTGDLQGASGATGDIGAGGSSNALTVSFSTAIAGVVSGTAAVALTSDGAGVDSLGTTLPGADEVPVTATIDNYATAAVTKVSGAAQLTGSGDDYLLNLGEVYVNGSAAAVSLGIENSAASLADLLEGGFSAESGSTQIALAGTAFAGLSAGQTAAALSATLSTAQVGTFESQITLLPTGYNSSGYSGALSAETITVIGTVANLAVGQVETASPIDFGNVRLNSTVTPRAIAVANLASSPADSLDATANASGSATVSGAISGLEPGNTNTTSILVGLNTGTVGVMSGAVAVDFLSDGGSGQTPLPSEDSSLSVSGTVYREASATIGAIAPLVLHTGQTANLSIAVTNNAVADGYSENLIANTTSVTSGIVSLIGGTGDIGAAAAGTLQASVSAATAGLLSGAVTLDLISDGTGIDGLGTVDLGPRTVAVTGTIYNYATVGVSVTNTGVLTGSGNSYVLHLGTLVQGATAATAMLGLTNIATGLADSLSGTATVSGGTSGFVDSGFGPIGTLSAGQASNQIDIALRTGTIGVYTETATFTPVSSDSAGATSLAPISITVTGTVVAQQGVIYNLTTGVDTVSGNSAVNTVIATGGALSAGDNINAGSGSSNVLTLQGAGVFNLGLPVTLTGISTVWAKEGQSSAVVNGVTYASTLQTVTLRAAENNVAVNVQPATPNPANPAATAITINGAANNDVINLGYGNDTVTPGVGETVNGGSGNATVMVTAATIGDAINGGSGTTKLWFTGGGTFVLGANLANPTSVYLAAASTAWNITATTTSGLTIQDGDTANNDRLVANGAIQVLTGGGAGKLTMQGAFDTTFQDSAALFNGDTLGFAAGDLIDITGLTYAASGAGQTTIGFTENGQHTGGSLTVSTGGVQKTAITLTGGIFNQGSFTAGSDNAGGTLIRYHA
jgi:hypothetical protein